MAEACRICRCEKVKGRIMMYRKAAKDSGNSLEALLLSKCRPLFMQDMSAPLVTDEAELPEVLREALKAARDRGNPHGDPHELCSATQHALSILQAEHERAAGDGRGGAARGALRSPEGCSGAHGNPHGVLLLSKLCPVSHKCRMLCRQNMSAPLVMDEAELPEVLREALKAARERMADKRARRARGEAADNDEDEDNDDEDFEVCPNCQRKELSALRS